VRLTTSHRKNYRCYETPKKLRLEATFKGGQDNYKAAEPTTTMMMMMISILTTCNAVFYMHGLTVDLHNGEVWCSF
jgi:hypothetical protein